MFSLDKNAAEPFLIDGSTEIGGLQQHKTTIAIQLFPCGSVFLDCGFIGQGIGGAEEHLDHNLRPVVFSGDVDEIEQDLLIFLKVKLLDMAFLKDQDVNGALI